jgi:hypothetical protein
VKSSSKSRSCRSESPCAANHARSSAPTPKSRQMPQQQYNKSQGRDEWFVVTHVASREVCEDGSLLNSRLRIPKQMQLPRCIGCLCGLMSLCCMPQTIGARAHRALAKEWLVAEVSIGEGSQWQPVGSMRALCCVSVTCRMGLRSPFPRTDGASSAQWHGFGCCILGEYGHPPDFYHRRSGAAGQVGCPL